MLQGTQSVAFSSLTVDWTVYRNLCTMEYRYLVYRWEPIKNWICSKLKKKVMPSNSNGRGLTSRHWPQQLIVCSMIQSNSFENHYLPLTKTVGFPDIQKLFIDCLLYFKINQKLLWTGRCFGRNTSYDTMGHDIYNSGPDTWPVINAPWSTSTR